MNVLFVLRSTVLLAWLVALPCAAHDEFVPIPVEPLTEIDTQRIPDVSRPGPRMDHIVGKIIERIEVRFDAAPGASASPSWTPKRVHPGDVFSLVASRELLSELEELGTVAHAGVSYELAGENSIVLIVQGAARSIVDHVAMHLHDAPIDRETILRTMGIAEGRDLTHVDLVRARSRLLTHTHRLGYPDVKIAINLRPADLRGRVRISIDLVPGNPRLIMQRFFYPDGISKEDLQAFAADYKVAAFERADEVALANADTSLELALRKAGYFSARATHDLVWFNGRVALRVSIHSGSKFVPRFEGNVTYDAEALTGALELEADNTDRNPNQLAAKIRAFYLQRGFLDVGVLATVGGHEGDPKRFLIFRVREGTLVRVMSRSYPCLDLRVIQKLRAGGPSTVRDIANEIDSYLEENAAGGELIRHPRASGIDEITRGTSTVRASQVELQPNRILSRESFERALEHVQELYRNEGFLHATVGPLQLIRATCSPASPPGECDPLPLPPLPKNQCTYDLMGVPEPSPALDAKYFCQPDVQHGRRCSPRADVLIPIKLGPRTTAYDLAFQGVRAFTHEQLAKVADAGLGEPASRSKLDESANRITDHYKNEGYPYVQVKYAIEESDDHTRARVRFDVTEGDQVYVRRIEIRGLDNTSESLVRKRIVLVVGLPYRADDARASQQAITTLGTFTSVTVSLEDPLVMQREKTVVIEVVERTRQYIEVRPGFSTGEGVRGAVEYGHRNLFGRAIGLTLRAQLSYLPVELIFDDTVAHNYEIACGDKTDKDGKVIEHVSPLDRALCRLARRITLSFTFPDIGLGSKASAQLDLIHARDLQRDFMLTKYSVVPTFTYRPRQQVTISFATSLERNDAEILAFADVAGANQGQCDQSTIDKYVQSEPDPTKRLALARILQVPCGPSAAIAPRLNVAWDRRDNPFNAHTGTFVAAGVEYVNSYPVANGTSAEGHFFRLTQTTSGYIPLGKRITFAMQGRAGYNVKVPWVTNSQTYPDRLFFLGGFNSMRGWVQDSLVPYELDQQLVKGTLKPEEVTARGGDLMLNARGELRFPLIGSFLDGVVFFDAGNLWKEPSNLYDMPFKLRSAAGGGLRLLTPVGPIVLDGGFNLTRRNYESLGALQFAVGLF